MSDHELSPHLPAERFGRILAVSTFPYGLSQASVHDVATEAGNFVLRLVPAKGIPAWRRELAVLRVVSDAGIAPRLEHADEATRATVSVKIPGQLSTALGDPSTRPRVIGNVVDLLARLHRLPTDAIGVADPVEAARMLWDEQLERPGFPAWAAPAAEHIDRGERSLATDTRRVFSHNDLNPSNVLWDGERAWLIDWSEAGLNHPYYDLAVFSTFLMLDDDAALALLARQEQEDLAPDQIDTFRTLRGLACTLCGTMFLRLAGEIGSLVPAELEQVPTLPEFYARLFAGALDFRSPRGQATFGAALLKRALG